MEIKTLVTWPLGYEHSEEVRQITDAEYDRLKAAGVTTGLFFKVDGAVKRVWATREAAQGWIDFLNSLETPPESAVVIEE